MYSYSLYIQVPLGKNQSPFEFSNFSTKRRMLKFNDTCFFKQLNDFMRKWKHRLINGWWHIPFLTA